jgi:hypothetical protein
VNVGNAVGNAEVGVGVAADPLGVRVTTPNGVSEGARLVVPNGVAVTNSGAGVVTAGRSTTTMQLVNARRTRGMSTSG